MSPWHRTNMKGYAKDMETMMEVPFMELMRNSKIYVKVKSSFHHPRHHFSNGGIGSSTNRGLNLSHAKRCKGMEDVGGNSIVSLSSL